MDKILIEILGLFGDGPFAWLAMAAAGLAAVGLRLRRRRRMIPPPRVAEPGAEPQVVPAETVEAPAVSGERVPSGPRAVPPPGVEPGPPGRATAEPAAEAIAPPAAPEPLRPAPVPAAPVAPAPAEPEVTEPAPPSTPLPPEIVEPAPAAPEPTAEPIPPAPSRVRLRDRLRRTSEAFAGRLSGLLGSGRAVDPALLDELEEVLLTADLGVATADSLLERVRREGQGRDAPEVRALLKGAIAEKLETAEGTGEPFALASKPHVILVLGVNGAGKTTTIGKLAAKHRALGRSVLLGAGDTFRAAAIEQLQVWGERVGCDVVAGEAGGDPASVAFDTVKAAVTRGVDVAIIDTAGRLQTKKPLMEELAKIARVIGRDVPGAPHETLLVLDANTGQNALSQARLFTEVAQVSGLVLTKLDGTAKGGVIVGLADQFGIPVRFVGVGESIDDLRVFEAGEFVDALFGEGD
ncbi:MAG: signal recognition particle-docking protein FtsY [Myxococcota bacterium]